MLLLCISTLSTLSGAQSSCDPTATIVLDISYTDVYSFPPSGITRYPDFELPTTGYTNAASCQNIYDLPAGCTVASGCTQTSCTYNSFAGLGQGQVEPTLGDDGFPVYRNNANDRGANARHSILGNKSFSGWWHQPTPFPTSPTMALADTLTLKQDCSTGLYTYSSSSFFPLDNRGLAATSQGSAREQQTKGDDGNNHNFGFTDSIHTQFIYKGNEVFEFRGDDDVWVFIDKQLVIDLGGLHQAICRKINLTNPASIIPTGGNAFLATDPCPTTTNPTEAVSLNLTVGQVYSLDFFHAERHSTGSNFKIATNIELRTVCKDTACANQYGPNSQCSCNGDCVCKPGYVLDANDQCNACNAAACVGVMGANAQCDCAGNCACKPGWQTDKSGLCTVARTTQMCSVWPDPHFRTFDGCQFNYHGTCDYVLLSTSMSGSPPAVANNVEIQIRTTKQDVTWDWTAITEVALSLGVDTVNVFLDGISLNGARLTNTQAGQTLGPFTSPGVTGKIIALTPQPTYLFTLPRSTGGVDTIKVFSHPSWGLWDGITVEVTAGNDPTKGTSRLWGSVGLCGVFDMSMDDDLTLPASAGGALATDVRSFAEAWTVPAGSSLLTGTPQTTQTCNFASQCPDPKTVTGNSSCTGNVSYSVAVATCQNALTTTTNTSSSSTSSTGVTIVTYNVKTTTEFSNCLFDLCVGGQLEFADQDVYHVIKCPDDCNGAGDCVDGTCQCYSGFIPPNCEQATYCPSTYTCPRGEITRSDPTTHLCATSTCADQDCCLGTCAAHSCTVGSLQTNLLSNVCNASSCTDAECCATVFTCPSTFTCNRGYTPRQSPPNCAASTCTNDECCAPVQVTCDAYLCSRGRIPNPSTPAASIVCVGTTCTDLDCCVATCSTASCSTGTVLKATAATIICNSLTCTNDMCCDQLPVCSTYTCGPGERANPNPSSTTCVATTCTALDCCTPVCDGYACASGVLRSDAATATCRSNPCTDLECCVTGSPTASPIVSPTAPPIALPTASPTASPSIAFASPTTAPYLSPTASPIASPTAFVASPTASPIASPTASPIASPTASLIAASPTALPTFAPIPLTRAPVAVAPTLAPIPLTRAPVAATPTVPQTRAPVANPPTLSPVSFGISSMAPSFTPTGTTPSPTRAPRTCAGFTCPANFALKARPATISCTMSGDGVTCLNTECCDLTCALYDAQYCSSGTLQGNPQSLRCDTFGCTSDLCCGTATPTKSPVKPPSTRTVAPSTRTPVRPPTTAPVRPPTARTAAPVRQTAAPVRPPTARTAAPVRQTAAPVRPPTAAPIRPPTAITAAPIRATPKPTVTCGSYVCTQGVLVVNPTQVGCPAAGCTEVTCCVAPRSFELTCQQEAQLCGAGTRLRDGASSIACALTPQSGAQTCTSALCCVPLPMCAADYTCSLGWTLKDNYDTITCTGSRCSDLDCCDNTAGSTGVCADYPCPFPALATRPFADNVTCKSSLCTDQECCVAVQRQTCTGFDESQCGLGEAVITNPSPSQIQCRGETPDYSDDSVISFCSATDCCQSIPPTPLAPPTARPPTQCGLLSGCASCVITPTCIWIQPLPLQSVGQCASTCVPSATQSCYGVGGGTGPACPYVPPAAPSYTPKLVCTSVPNYVPMTAGPLPYSYTYGVPSATTTTSTGQISTTIVVPATSPSTTTTTTGGQTLYVLNQKPQTTTTTTTQQQITPIPQTTSAAITGAQPYVTAVPVLTTATTTTQPYYTLNAITTGSSSVQYSSLPSSASGSYAYPNPIQQQQYKILNAQSGPTAQVYTTNVPISTITSSAIGGYNSLGRVYSQTPVVPVSYTGSVVLLNAQTQRQTQTQTQTQAGGQVYLNPGYATTPTSTSLTSLGRVTLPSSPTVNSYNFPFPLSPVFPQQQIQRAPQYSYTYTPSTTTTNMIAPVYSSGTPVGGTIGTGAGTGISVVLNRNTNTQQTTSFGQPLVTSLPTTTTTTIQAGQGGYITNGVTPATTTTTTGSTLPYSQAAVISGFPNSVSKSQTMCYYM